MSYEPCESCGRPSHHWGLCRDCEVEEREGMVEFRGGLWAETPAAVDMEEYDRVA